MSDPLLDGVARTLCDLDYMHARQLSGGEPCDTCRSQADAVLAAIAETRRLLPAHVNAVVVATTEAAEGFAESVEWGVRYPDLHPEPVRCLDEGTARRAAEVAGRTLMRRHVYTGPWEPVTEPDD